MATAARAFLTPRDVAAAIGVSESSLKRWADDGFLRATRTAGGHRRIARAEVVRFIREARVPVVRPELLGFGDVALRPATAAPDAESLFEAFCGDDPAAARSSIVSGFLAGATIAAICDGPLRGALERLGELWRHGPEGIVLEHRAVDTAVQALGAIRAAMPAPAPDAPRALGGAVSGDPYVLPSLAAALVLREVGFADVNLGPDVPFEALLGALDRYRPGIVWRTMSCDVDPQAMRGELVGIAEHVGARDGMLVAGGRTSGALAAAGARHDRLLILGSMSELAAFARGMLARRPPQGEPPGGPRLPRGGSN